MARPLTGNRTNLSRVVRHRIFCGCPRCLRLHAVHIDELHSGCIQPLRDDLRKSLQKFIAQVMILFAFRPQAFAIQGNGAT